MAPQQQPPPPQPDAGRDRVSNPSFHSPPPYSSTSSTYAPPPPPPVAQPPPRQPPFDPFRVRDPFLPAASSDKQRDARPPDGIHSDLLHHPPAAPLQSPFHHPASSLMPYKDDHTRPKSSMHGSSYDHHGPHQPPPPAPVSSAPPSSSASILGGRQMPPPASATSPLGSSSRPQSGPHSPLQAPAYGVGREPPNNGPTKHRSNSSMSIQSMMAQETAPLPPPQPHSGQNRPWSPVSHNTAGLSAYARPLSPFRENHQPRRPRTPEKRYEGAASQGYPPPPPSLPPPPPSSSHHSSAHSPNHYSSIQPHSPDAKRNSISHLTQPVHFAPPTNSASPPRPFSQPTGADTMQRPEEHHRNGYAAISRPSDPYERPASQHQPSSTPFGRTSSRDRALSDQDARADPFSRDSYATRPFSRNPAPERQFAPIGPSPRSEAAEPQYGQIWKDRPPPPPQQQQQSSRDSSFYARPNEAGPVDNHQAVSPLKQHHHHHHQSSALSQPPFDSTRFPASSSSSQHQELNASSGTPAISALPAVAAANGGATDASARMTPTRLNSFQSRTPNVDPHLRKSIEENQAQHRAILGISIDSQRRLDRGSPLPQAVQGAQAQPAGSGRDPSIKSEFGRMFSGLGSGIGSTPQPLTSNPHGHPPSGRQSPMAGDDLESEALQRRLQDGETIRGSGTSSRGGRRGKRTFEEDARMDSISPEGRVTPVGAVGRAGKKSKVGHPGQSHHHHHPHPHTHHYYHHHHRKQDEENSAPSMARRTSGTPFIPPRSSSNPQSNGALPGNAAAPGHHHHHYPAGPHHHHYHPPPPPHHHHHVTAPVRSQPIHRPITTIKTNALLQNLSSFPRKHLGSHLYAPTVTTPPSHTFSLGSTHMFSTKPNPLPRFSQEKHSNCTLTVRVPRYYLTQHSREAICADRRLWGTDVYTDDSDPVAAAIHGGWMRGAWGEDIDVSLLLELSSENGKSKQGSNEQRVDEAAAPTENQTNQTQGEDVREKESDAREGAERADLDGKSPSKQEEQKAVPIMREINTPPPSGPQDPPEKVDLHITLLIIPPLEKYASSVWHGVKSRSWGNNHDGMSFKILKLEYVDEGIDSRNEERHRQKIKRSSGSSAAKSKNKKEKKGNDLRVAMEFSEEAGRPFGNTSRAVPTIGTKMMHHKKPAGGGAMLRGGSSLAAAAAGGSRGAARSAKRLKKPVPVVTSMASGLGKVGA